MTKKIVFLDCKSVGEDIDLTRIDALGEVEYYDDILSVEIPSAIEKAEVIITNKKKLNKSNLENAKNLKLICLTATGFNNIDIEYCKQRGIQVSNVKGYSTNSVAQHTFSLLLDLYNKNHYYHDFISNGNYSNGLQFSHFKEPFYELSSKTWGIVGLGDIGKAVGRIAKAFGCNVQYYSTSGKNVNSEFLGVDFKTLLETSDIISIHAPLNENTRNLFAKEQFSLMKKSAYIINVGRGKIINEVDLVEALQESEIAGAGLDVFSKEPILIDSPLLKINNPSKLLLTPHIAWAAFEARNRVIDEVCLNIIDYFVGKERNAC